MKESIDAADIRILEILQRNARTPLKTIAERVFLSPPTVAARIEALEEAGILLGYHADVNEKVIGHPVKAIIDLAVTPDKKYELYPLLQSSPEVIECCYITGEFSLHVETITDSTESLDRFVSKLQRFGRTQTQIVFSTVVPHRGFELPKA